MKYFENVENAETTQISIARLHPFQNHPYNVRDDEEMEELMASIVENGILSPVIVRPLEDQYGEYEIISGHRRCHAAQRAGLHFVPAFVVNVSRDEATVMLVDSNIHREHILPSEKAFAYKMKLDAIKHQGVTRGQIGHKSRDSVSEEESGRTIQRYIRLTYLIPDLLQMVDDGKIAVSVGVQLSWLDEAQQRAVLNAAVISDCTPSYSQAVRMKNQNASAELSIPQIAGIMSEEKANQKDRVSFALEDIRKFFPASYTQRDIRNELLMLMEQAQRHRERNRKNDAR